MIYTQGELENYARLEGEGALTLTDFNTPGGGRASDYDWHDNLVFPLSNLIDPEYPDAWKGFYEEWQPIYVEDGGYDRLGEMKQWLDESGDYPPIIVVRWTDGKYYLWDGTHRTSCLVVLGRKTAIATVGTPKTPSE